MDRIDYCVYIFTEDEQALGAFASPEQIETAWGPGVRAEEYGRLMWSNELFVAPCNLDSLLDSLPPDRRGIAYAHLQVGGSFVDVLPLPDKHRAEEASHDRLSTLSEMILHLCANSGTWALFFLAFCEYSDVTYYTDLDRAINLVESFLQGEMPGFHPGFCVFSE